MSIFAERTSKLKPSLTFAISGKAKKMKQEGIDVIDLSLGEPDFNAPREALEAGSKALFEGKTKYTNIDGTPDLKKCIQKKFKEENNLFYELDEIFVSNGAKQGIFNTFAASLNEGDEVIIPAPYWVSYVDIVELFRGKPVIIKTTQENNFKLQPEDLKNAITSKTKWLFINSPSNPTGEVYTEQELQKIAEVLREHKNIFVLSDDIYEHLTFDDLKFTNILNVAPDLSERVIIINGVSKSYSMTGFRIGYGAMKNKDFIKMVVNLQGQSTSGASSISQEASIGALTYGAGFIKNSKEVMEKRRDLVFNELSKIPEFTIKKPSGAFYIFIGISKLYGKKTTEGKVLQNDEDVSSYLLTEGKVATVFGVAFGYPDFIRISYATNEEILKKAILNIKSAILKLS